MDFKSFSFMRKVAWSSSLSASLQVRADKFEGAQHLVAANNLIGALVNPPAPFNDAQLANDWIDSPRVNIRENNNCDNVIDYFLPPDLSSTPSFSADGPVFQQASDFVGQAFFNGFNSLADMETQLSHRLESLQNRVVDELETLVKQQINQEGGLSILLGVLSNINLQNEEFISQMTTERASLLLLQPPLYAHLHTYAEHYAQGGSFFQTKSSLLRKLGTTAQALALNRRQVLRRDFALRFFNWLRIQIFKRAFAVRELLAKLDSLHFSYNQKLLDVLYQGTDNDFSVVSASNLPASLSLFLPTLPGQTLLSLLSMPLTEVEERILSFSSKISPVV